MNPLRVGILGTGNVVRDFHLPALAANARARIVAIGNHRASSIEPLVRQFGIEKTYTDLPLMARDGDIDLVVNALPNSLHAPLSIAMLASGKHVLCEKPMAITVLEAQGMVAAAEMACRKLMIAHVWRSNREVQWLRDLIRSGKLGRVLKITAHAKVAGRGPDPDSWFVRQEMAGGGALADVGIHAIDTISFLFDDGPSAIKVSARIGNDHRPFDVEDTASAVVEYDNGVVAEIEAGWYAANVADVHGAIEVFGTEGYARILPASWYCRSRNAWQDCPSRVFKHPDVDATMYAAQVDHFVDCILEDRRPVCDGRQGLSDMIVLEAAYASARRGCSVSLEPRAGNCND